MPYRTSDEGFVRIPEEIARIALYHPRFKSTGLFHIRIDWVIRQLDGARFCEIYGLSPGEVSVFMDFCVQVTQGLVDAR